LTENNFTGETKTFLFLRESKTISNALMKRWKPNKSHVNGSNTGRVYENYM
jgi:hypothetical protein